MEPSLTEPVAKRADQLVVGDRIPDEHLAFRFNQGPAEVVFLAHEAARERDPLPWVFVAYQYPNGRHDSMTIRPEAELTVFPAPDPDVTQPLPRDFVDGLCLDPECPNASWPHSASSDLTQPLGERRLVGDRGVWAVPVGGGLVEVDPPEGFVPASAPKPKRCPACLSAEPSIRCHVAGFLCDDPSRFHEQAQS